MKPNRKKHHRKSRKTKGYMYILECTDGSYYIGSTKNLESRIKIHQAGNGANHTKKRLPVALVYYERFKRVSDAFYREKQVQGWRREKKEALIKAFTNILPDLSKAYRDKDILNTVPSSTSGTGNK